MPGMQERELKLPRFVIDSELSRVFREQLPEYLSMASGFIIFDWSEVCFFDDCTLLKLILIQRRFRLLGARVSNRGLTPSYSHANRQVVIRQLWTVGLPELTASGHLIASDWLKDALQDEAELLESDPFYGRHVPEPGSTVIPMLCCHDPRYFAPGSREEKRLDAFIGTCLRPSGVKSLAWDLVESRDFRHRLVQQLRRNVQEHSPLEGGGATGLAIVRVWTCTSLTEQWLLKDTIKAELLRVWGQEPLPSMLHKLNPDHGILSISIVDDGIGIPRNLHAVHEGLLADAVQLELPPAQERLYYNDTEFERRFAEPGSWSDTKARLIAFATDLLGTSKSDRAPEVKGLHYLSQDAVLKMHGAMFIESDGAAIGNISQAHRYGQPRDVQFPWCNAGGTAVCLAVPMAPVESSGDKRNRLASPVEFGCAANNGCSTEQFRISAQPINSIQNPKREDFVSCAKAVLDVILLPEAEDDILQLRSRGLLIVDWGKLRESKRFFHYLLVEIAKGLSDANPRRMRPFVFANLPKGLCALLDTAIAKFSTVHAPTPICAFTTEQREPFWLGLDGISPIPEELRTDISCEIRRKLNDHKENRAEAFCRDCLSRLLASEKPFPLSNASILGSVRYQSQSAILRSDTFSRLDVLLRRCALFREEQRSVDGRMVYTGCFRPVFRSGEIASQVRSLFLDKFRDVFENAPVCFLPPDVGHGVRLPHSNRIVARYFRSDALVDSDIAMELTYELTAIALDIASQTPNGRIDWVVSCTSPPHWFVHKIVDGLAEQGMSCSHHVFQSYGDIPSSIGDIEMRPDETVLVFTDVIATGQTAYRIAHTLVNHFNVTMAGLIALADIRTAEDRKKVPDLAEIYGGRLLCLYNKPEPHRKDLRPAYFVHPETVVPKRDLTPNPVEEFFERNYCGVGPLVERHAYFSSPKRTLDLLTELNAVRFGHFQHGTHHSEIFVDVEKVLAYHPYRDLVISALFRYIIANDIRLVLYPSHSSAYMLADDLKQRFIATDLSVEFLMACRTFRGSRGTSYALTRFSPDPEHQWKDFSTSAVLILDDAVCSGATVESIIAELARIDRNYYAGRGDEAAVAESQFSVHVVAFLNRLPRITGDFWRGLSQITGRRIEFSAFITMPLVADSAELCPVCHLMKRLQHMKVSEEYCLYAKEFMTWWLSSGGVVFSRERRHCDTEQATRFTSAEALRLAGYISAIERGAYHTVRNRLFDAAETPGGQESTAVRVHIRSRAGFLHALLPKAEGPVSPTVNLCKELEALIGLALDDGGLSYSPQSVLEILQALSIRYIRMSRTQDEAGAVFECLLARLAPSFDNRLIVGGIACILDSSIKWFSRPQHTDKESAGFHTLLREKLLIYVRDAHLSKEAKLMVDWLATYLAEGGKRIDSVGRAVQMLAEYAKKGRPNHFYGRYDLDELQAMFRLPATQASADEDSEAVRRALICTDRLSELVSATRVLRSASMMDEKDLRSLQDDTERDIQKLRKLCTELLRRDSAHDTSKGYEKVKSLFLGTYDRWFLQTERPRAAVIIGYFTPYLCDSLNTAWTSFAPQRRTKEVITISLPDSLQHKKVRVLVDPSVLTTAMRQLLDNVDKLAAQGAPATIVCQVCFPDEENDAAKAFHKVGPNQVGVLVSNSGTPHPDPVGIRLQGLSAVQMRLSEYGGGLDYAFPGPTTGWSFQVMMRLSVWTEEEE